MTAQNIAQLTLTPASDACCGTVSSRQGEELLIDADIEARRAMSCLVEAEVGDRVLYVRDTTRAYVLAVLEGERPDAAAASLPNGGALTLSASRLALFAARGLDVASRGKLSLRSTDTVEVNARDYLVTACQSLVQVARQYFSRARQISLEAQELLRSHGHHQVITATEDVKVDGERISMG